MNTKTKLLSAGAIGALLLVGTLTNVRGTESAAKNGTEASARVERGRYLVSIIGCSDCHTPFKMTPTGPEPDMDRYLSGHPQNVKLPPPKIDMSSGWVMHGAGTNTAFAGPWGVTYAANLTPDHLSGLGIWTESQFVAALRTGTHWGAGVGKSRPIMPPMPWQSFRNMTDEDLTSIYAYLRTVKPVSNNVPNYEPPSKPSSPPPAQHPMPAK